MLEQYPTKEFDDYVRSPQLDEIVQMFQHYCLIQSQSHPTFALWMLYIEMVQLLLLFIRATRESDWFLHLSTIRSMLPWFFVADRVHYSRYASVYWTEMSCLQNTHPG